MMFVPRQSSPPFHRTSSNAVPPFRRHARSQLCARFFPQHSWHICSGCIEPHSLFDVSCRRALLPIKQSLPRPSSLQHAGAWICRARPVARNPPPTRIPSKRHAAAGKRCFLTKLDVPPPMRRSMRTALPISPAVGTDVLNLAR